jgi:hypothetical protein
MNKARRHLNRLLLALACAALACGGLIPNRAAAAGKSSASPAAKSQQDGHLIIIRAANLGTTIVAISIDGVKKGDIGFNGRFETSLTPGEHILTTIPAQNREHATPVQTRLVVKPGQTYTLTAKRSDVRVILK